MSAHLRGIYSANRLLMSQISLHLCLDDLPDASPELYVPSRVYVPPLAWYPGELHLSRCCLLSTGHPTPLETSPEPSCASNHDCFVTNPQLLGESCCTGESFSHIKLEMPPLPLGKTVSFGLPVCSGALEGSGRQEPT